VEPDKVKTFLENNRTLLGKEFKLNEKKSGESNHNFILEADNKKYVLRVSRKVSRKSRLREESKALEFLEETEIENIPRKAWFGETEIGSVLIETFVGNKDLQKGDFTEKDLKKSAQLLAKIHSTKIEKYNDFFNTEKNHKASLREIYATEYKKWSERPYREYLEAAKEPDERIKKAYKKQKKLFENVPDIEVEQTPVHGDLGFNVRKSSSEIFFVDWEYFTAGYPGHDIVYFFEHEGLSMKERELFLQEYRKHRKLGEEFEENRERYKKFLAFNDAVWAAKRIASEEGNKKKMEKIFKDKITQLEELHGGLSG